MHSLASSAHWLYRQALRLALVGLLLVSLYVLAGRLLSPLAEGHSASIEHWLGQQLQQEVRLGQLQVRWRGLAPQFYAQDVQLGPTGHSLQLARLAFRPDLLASLWHRQWRLDTLELGGLSLELHEDSAGQWQLQGLNWAAEPSQTGPDWLRLHQLLRQLGHFALHDAQVQLFYQDGRRHGFTHMGLSLNPVGHGLLLQARLRLPDQQQLALRSRLDLKSGGWQDAALRLYLQVPDSNWAAWLPGPLLSDLTLERAQLAGEFWLSKDGGGPLQLAASLTGAQLTGVWQDQPQQLVLGTSQWSGQQQGQQWALWSEKLPWRLGQGAWQSTGLQLGWQGAQEQQPGWQLALQQLELAPLMAAVQQWPLPPLALDVLKTLDFQGRLHNLNVHSNPQNGWQALSYDTNLEQLSWSPGHHSPGASGVSGRLLGTPQGGSLLLDSPEGFSLHLDELFALPWTYHSARARLDWSLQGTAFSLASPFLQVSGNEGELAGDFALELPDADSGREPYLDLRVGLRDGDASFVERYLPRVLSGELHDWLVSAIQQGHIHQGYYQFQGSLAAGAPDSARTNSLFFDVSQAQLNYQPGWPALQDARALVYVGDHDVQVELEQGRVLDSQIGPAHARVDYGPGAQPAKLQLEAELLSSLTDGLHLVQRTPLASSVPALADWRGQGKVPARLQLDVPLDNTTPHVRLALKLQDARLDMPSTGLKFSGLQGELKLDSQLGLSSPQLQGRLLGQPFSTSVSPLTGADDWSAVFKANGTMPLTALQQGLAYQEPLPATGSLDYALALELVGSRVQLAVTSDLQGINIELPAPLGKTTEQRVASRWQWNLDERQNQHSFEYGNQLSALLAEQGNRWRGQLLLGGGRARLPAEQGIQLAGQLGQVDGEAWQQALDKFTAGAANQPSGLAAVDLSIARLNGLPLTLEQLKVKARPVPGRPGWRWQLQAKQLEGEVELVDGQPVQLQLHRLQLPTDWSSQAGNSRFDPASLPAFRAQIDQLLINDQLLGSWHLRNNPQPGGAHLHDLDLELKGARLQGEFWWDAAKNSRFQGSLLGEDLAQVLDNWGYAPSATAENFSLVLNVQWPGGLGQLTASELSGIASFRLRKGQLLALDGSKQALRVFGILNFDTIGRRLRLDFRDLLGKGLAFDRIDGELHINRGLYQSNGPISLTGVSSNLSLEGSADARRELLDASLELTVPISRNLPLVALAAGAPAVGGALFVFDRLVGDRFSRMAAVRYRVQGNWLDPEISLSRELPAGAKPYTESD